MKQISLRIDEETMERTEELSELEKLERSKILRQALKEGLDNLVKKTVVELYREDKISLSEAADLTDLGIGELLSLLKKHGVKSKITQEDLEKGKETAEEIAKQKAT